MRSCRIQEICIADNRNSTHTQQYNSGESPLTCITDFRMALLSDSWNWTNCCNNVIPFLVICRRMVRRGVQACTNPAGTCQRVQILASWANTYRVDVWNMACGKSCERHHLPEAGFVWRAKWVSFEWRVGYSLRQSVIRIEILISVTCICNKASTRTTSQVHRYHDASSKQALSWWISTNVEISREQIQLFLGSSINKWSEQSECLNIMCKLRHCHSTVKIASGGTIEHDSSHTLDTESSFLRKLDCWMSVGANNLLVAAWFCTWCRRPVQLSTISQRMHGLPCGIFLQNPWSMDPPLTSGTMQTRSKVPFLKTWLVNREQITNGMSRDTGFKNSTRRGLTLGMPSRSTSPALVEF